MALIGKECLNCGETHKGSSLCPKCEEAINTCPKCKGEINNIIQSNFNYFVSCSCGYYGRPLRNTQTAGIE